MEYALLLGLVALTSTIAFQGVGIATGNLLGTGQTAMAGVESGTPGGSGDPGASGGSGDPGAGSGGGPGGGGGGDDDD